jgi:hypothetical protein
VTPPQPRIEGKSATTGVHGTRRIWAQLWYSRRFWLIALVTIGVLWRLTRYFLNFPIFSDEAVVGLNILNRSYMGLLRPLDYIVACPVGFLWMSKWMIDHFGTSTFAVRFIPLVASLASVLVMYPVARKFAGPWVAMLATGLLACSLSPALFSNDFKPYSIDLLVALTYTGLGFWALRRPRDWAPLLALILFTPLALVCSYPSVFVGGAVSLALMVRLWQIRSASRTAWYVLFNVVWLGCFALLFFTVTRGQLRATHQEGIVRAWGTAFPPLNWHLGWWLIRAQFGNMMSYPMGGEWGISLLISPLCWLGAWRLWSRGRGAELVLLVAPFLATLAASFLRDYPYGRDARVEQHLVPAIMLLTSLGLFNTVVFLLRAARHKRQAIRSVVAAACVGMAIFAIVAAAINIDHPWISHGWYQMRQVLRDVFTGAEKHTQIVILGGLKAIPTDVQWYLRGERHTWRTALPTSNQLSHVPIANLWVVSFSLQAQKNVLAHVAQQLAQRKVVMNLVENRRQCIHLGGVGPPVYVWMLHFKNTG